jgi:hypothetical protein
MAKAKPPKGNATGKKPGGKVAKGLSKKVRSVKDAKGVTPFKITGKVRI